MPVVFPTPERQPSIADAVENMKNARAKRAVRKESRMKRGRDFLQGEMGRVIACPVDSRTIPESRLPWQR